MDRLSGDSDIIQKPKVQHIHAYMNLSGKRTEKAICSIYYTSIYKYIYLYISQYNLKVMYSIQAEKLVSFP